MKKVTLTRLELRNFKKITSLSIDFTHETDIVGTNGVGKSTIFDAYTWLLYGKNSHDQNDFAIKTLDENNRAIPKLEHEVVGTFDVDSKIITFKRVYREKWVTKRGNDLEELTGHETTFFVNDVPKSKGEYQTSVSEMIDENISKIISNPLYFNEKMKWDERRKILSSMAGEIKTDEIVSQMNGNIDELREMLAKGDELNEQKKVVQAKKKKLKEELATIKPRIDEARYNMPEPVDACAVQNEIISLDGELNSIDEQMQNRLKSVEKAQEQAKKVQEQKYELNSKLNELQNEFNQSEKQYAWSIQSKRAELENEIKTLVQSSSVDTTFELSAIENLKEKNNKLRDHFVEVSNMIFDENCQDKNCPTCKQSLPDYESKVEELRSAFNVDKLNQLDSIREQGKNNNTLIEKYANEINKINSNRDIYLTQIEQKKTYLQEWEKSIIGERPATTPEIEALKVQIESIVIPSIELPDISDLREAKATISQEIDAKKQTLNVANQIAKTNERIAELESQQRTLAQEVASCEKIEMQIDQYNKIQIETIEQRVNSKFSIVKWKMFDEQINGGLADTCEAIVNGTPFNDLNTAMKYNAGLDVINALNYHFGIFTPVFIDQRESIVSLIKTECQVINLKVDESKKELTIIN
jgi:DNA repair exonuclease SbcCD ATPase subunit